MSVVETNLVQCSNCDAVYIDDIATLSKAGFRPCPNCDTPDLFLAQYLTRCLEAFDEATRRRTKLYNKTD